MLKEKQKNRLPAMVMAWLLVNPQSESAQQNVLKLVGMMCDEEKEKLFSMIKTDLTARLQQQKLAIQEQIEHMEE